MTSRYDIYLVGVGGQGVLTIGEIITTAAFRKGIPVNFYPTKGMAQRGGFVKAQLRLGRETVGPSIPEKGADLVIATEVSETLKAVRFIKPGGDALGQRGPVRLRLGADGGDAGQGALPDAGASGGAGARGGRQPAPHRAESLPLYRRRARAGQHLCAWASALKPDAPGPDSRRQPMWPRSCGTAGRGAWSATCLRSRQACKSRNRAEGCDAQASAREST